MNPNLIKKLLTGEVVVYIDFYKETVSYYSSNKIVIEQPIFFVEEIINGKIHEVAGFDYLGNFTPLNNLKTITMKEELEVFLTKKLGHNAKVTQKKELLNVVFENHVEILNIELSSITMDSRFEYPLISIKKGTQTILISLCLMSVYSENAATAIHIPIKK